MQGSPCRLTIFFPIVDIVFRCRYMFSQISKSVPQKAVFAPVELRNIVSVRIKGRVTREPGVIYSLLFRTIASFRVGPKLPTFLEPSHQANYIYPTVTTSSPVGAVHRCDVHG